MLKRESTSLTQNGAGCDRIVAKMKLQRWRGFRSINALKAAPALEFVCFLRVKTIR